MDDLGQQAVASRRGGYLHICYLLFIIYIFNIRERTDREDPETRLAKVCAAWDHDAHQCVKRTVAGLK